MSENKRRRSSSTGFWGRIRQSARHIENEAKEGARRVEHSAAEGARRVQHDAQERVRNMTPKQKNGWKKAGRIIGTLLLVFVLTASIFAGIFMAYINSAMRGKVEVYLDEFETQVSTELYYQDPDTQEWVMYQTLYMDENRIWVDLENIPKYLQDAAVAIEDKRFEKHHGVDWKGTTRAILYTLFGKNVQGGSTITQQLVKNVTGDNQVTVKRKITEIYRAFQSSTGLPEFVRQPRPSFTSKKRSGSTANPISAKCERTSSLVGIPESVAPSPSATAVDVDVFLYLSSIFLGCDAIFTASFSTCADCLPALLPSASV